jgi:2-phosphoglycerate kinase
VLFHTNHGPQARASEQLSDFTNRVEVAVVAKIVVIKEPGGERAPFLRGILVQSLLAAGLSFEEAYSTAQTVRNDLLANNAVVTTAELRARMAEQLEKDFGPALRRDYETRTGRPQEIMVHSDRGESPFSADILTRSLEACVLDRKSAIEIALRIQESIQKRGQSGIEPPALRRLIYQSLKEHCSKEAANYYLSRRQFKTSGEPLIILLGGATGTGKSTISSELAYRLGVVRTQSTDMMREIIRSYLAPDVVPTLGFSSFDAWRGLPGIKAPDGRRKTDKPVIAGFLDQFAHVRSALEATIARALKERQDMILDGIHVLPMQLDLARAHEAAVVVPVMLAVTTRQQLANQLSWRSREQPDRGSSRYLKELDAIWELQSFLLNQAEKAHIPVIANRAIEDTVREVLLEVNHRISERYPPDPGILE